MKFYRRFKFRYLVGLLCLVIAANWNWLIADQGSSMGESKFVDVDGIRTRYFEAGQGEAMVLVHGAQFGRAAGASHNWMPIFPSLAKHFHVYALDKLGMGLTDNPKSDEGYWMQATVEHIYSFMKVMGIKKAHLVGHSRGALPVAAVLLDHPKMVKTLTIFNSNTLAPGDPVPRSRRSNTIPRTADSIRQFWEKGFGAFRKDFITEEYIQAELEIAQQPKIEEAWRRLEVLRKRFAEQNPEKIRARPALAHSSGTGWWLHEVKDKTLHRIQEGELKTPTLVIWGYTDPSATYDMGINLFRLISQSVDRAEFHLFNLCGHFPYQEYPEEVTNLMVGFIEQVGE